MWLKRKHEIIAECPLADYVNGAQTEKVPFVFMPPQGHLINANAEISLSGNISHYSLNYFFLVIVAAAAFIGPRSAGSAQVVQYSILWV